MAYASNLSSAHRWQPGQVANPLGGASHRHKLARYVRETTDEGRAPIDLLVRIMRGEEPGSDGTTARCLQLRLEAATELMDRGYGKATAHIESTNETRELHLHAHQLVAGLHPDELRQLVQLLSKAQPAPAIEHTDTIDVAPTSIETTPATDTAAPVAVDPTDTDCTDWHR